MILRKSPLWIGASLVLLAALVCVLSRALDEATTASQAALADQRARPENDSQQRLQLLNQKAIAWERRQRLDVIQRLEWMTYDWRMRRLAADTGPSTNLGLVLADNSTIDQLARGEAIPGENWDLLWPRGPVYGRLLHELRLRGASAIAFDILLTDRRYSEDQLGRLRADGEPEVYSSDREFARELSAEGSPVVLALEPAALPAALFHRATAAVGDASSPRDADGVARKVRAFTDYRWINPQLGAYIDENQVNIIDITPAGNLRIQDPDTGEEHRFEADAEGRVSLPIPWKRPFGNQKIQVHQSERVWHLGIALAAQHLGLDLTGARILPGEIELSGVQGVRRRIPVDANGYLPVRWSLEINQSGQIPHENLATLIHEGIVRGTNPPPAGGPWHGRMVVVGSTASGNNLSDRGATPLNPSDYLVMTYLNVARMVQDGQFIRQTPFVLELALVACLASLSVVSAWRLRTHVSPWVIAATAGAWILLAATVFSSHQIWLPIAHPVVSGLILPFGGMVTYRAIFEQREQQRIRGIFSRMVSPNIVHEVLETRKVALGGARREITVLFADIRGFSALTDSRQRAAEERVARLGLQGAEADACFEAAARQVLDTVNLYLGTIADVVKQHDGTLDKYIGDCVMAFWGAPTDNPHHAVRAVEAGIEIQRSLARLNERRAQENAVRQEGDPEANLLEVGTGINTGLVTVGLMGSENHMVNYTAFGREVNLASRLEGVAGHSRVVIGANTFAHLERETAGLLKWCRPLEPVRVKGFLQAVPVYEVTWRTENPPDAKT